MTKNAIGHFNHAPSGCFWYRIKHPMEVLSQSGIKVVCLPINEDIDEETIDSLMSVQLYGAYPFNPEKILKYFKEKGIKIVYDMDDALDLIEETNPFYYSVNKDAGSVKMILEHADEVTVSTPQMAQYAKERTKAKVTIVPNCFIPSEWNFERPTHEGIRIGFAGASPHVPDLIEIIPVIKNLQEKYKVQFVIMGFGSSDYESWFKSYRYIAQPKATEELRKLDELLKTIKFEWVPFVDYSLYPQTLINLRLDIGICPLRDTPFNDYRSACKAMEYTLAGALAISSNSKPYQEDTNSIMVFNGEWEQMLASYIELSSLSKAMREGCLKWTKENRDLTSKDKVDLLKSVYVV